MRPSRARRRRLWQILLPLALATKVTADCIAQLPVAGLEPTASPVSSPSPPAVISTRSRILSGIPSRLSDRDNMVTITTMDDGLLQYRCAGTVIAPEWILTSALCFISNRDIVRHGGGSSLAGFEYDIEVVFRHPEAGDPSAPVARNDLQLVKLTRPIKGTIVEETPSPSPSGQPDTPVSTTPSPSPQPLSTFNFMQINTNVDFAVQGTPSRYLRVKGYGLQVRPQDSEDPITGSPRSLTFTDLRTANCDDGFGSDVGRRICTKRDRNCGPCFGDTGSPLYDVDASGEVGVQVGIVTFGATAIDVTNPSCTDGRKPVAYTALAQYASWINETTGGRATFFELPPEGITDTDLKPEGGKLSTIAKMSVIVISSLALIGLICALVVTCVLRTLRRRRRRWIDGLHAEESFVKGGKDPDAVIVDPFEGILEDRKNKRASLTGLSRAAVKSAGEFSSKSIGAVRALLKQMEEQEDEESLEERDAIDDAPQWLPGAWDKLFRPPSKKDQLEIIHTVPTQRVVDDVLEGGDKSVEPSLEDVAFKNARDEANMEAAWRRLEVQTSLRNLSETSGSADGVRSPNGPSSINSSKSNSRLGSRQGSSRQGSRQGSSRQGSRQSSSRVIRALSNRMGGGDLVADHARADNLLAAFASIDAESEQVAEETVIDSSALRALAMAKRPNVLAALRKKFSNGIGSGNHSFNRSNSDRGSESEASRVASSHGPGSVRSPGTPTKATSNVGAMLGNSLVNMLSSRGTIGSGRAMSSSTSGFSSGVESSQPSRNLSMHVDYFSEDYSLSDSSSDEEVHFEDYSIARHRRFTNDRADEGPMSQDSLMPSTSGKGIRAFRKGPVRSFESLENLERKSSSGSMSSDEDVDSMRVTEYGQESAAPKSYVTAIGSAQHQEDEANVATLLSRYEDITAGPRYRGAVGSSAMWAEQSLDRAAVSEDSNSTSIRMPDREDSSARATLSPGASLSSWTPSNTTGASGRGAASSSSVRAEAQGPAASAWGTDSSMTKPDMEDSSTVGGVQSFTPASQPPAVARAIARMGFDLEDGVMGEGLGDRDEYTGFSGGHTALSVKMLKDVWNDKISRDSEASWNS